MPASSSNRLVFVSIKGKSAKRKVAVPVSQTTTYAEFVQTVRQKLKLQGVGDMELAGGVPLTALEQLEDIAEVLVTERPTAAVPPSAADPSPFIAAAASAQAASAHSHRIADTGDTGDADHEPFESKYVKKQSDVALAMKRMQSLFGVEQSSLPLTRKDTSSLTPIEQVKRRMKKRRRSVFDPRTLLALFSIISVAIILVFVYLRVTAANTTLTTSTTTMMANAIGRKQHAGDRI